MDRLSWNIRDEDSYHNGRGIQCGCSLATYMRIETDSGKWGTYIRDKSDEIHVLNFGADQEFAMSIDVNCSMVERGYLSMVNSRPLYLGRTDCHGPSYPADRQDR